MIPPALRPPRMLVTGSSASPDFFSVARWPQIHLILTVRASVTVADMQLKSPATYQIFSPPASPAKSRKVIVSEVDLPKQSNAAQQVGVAGRNWHMSINKGVFRSLSTLFASSPVSQTRVFVVFTAPLGVLLPFFSEEDGLHFFVGPEVHLWKEAVW